MEQEHRFPRHPSGSSPLDSLAPLGRPPALEGTTMRRADRLFRIVQQLRRRRVTTADRLAEELGVSARTIYRDMRDLSLSGVPIEGEAGVGYGLPHGFDLPPLMFREDEVEALVLGARMVATYTDQAL